jgi:hypothetical protein
MCDEEDEYYMRKELRDAGSTGKSCPRRRSFGSWRWIVNFNSLKIMRGEFAGEHKQSVLFLHTSCFVSWWS